MVAKYISAAVIPGIPAFPDDPSLQSFLLSGHSCIPVIPAFRPFQLSGHSSHSGYYLVAYNCL
jgi:hypothetical protein